MDNTTSFCTRTGTVALLALLGSWSCSSLNESDGGAPDATSTDAAPDNAAARCIPATAFDDTSDGIHPYQQWDFVLKPADALADSNKYGAVISSVPAMAQYWCEGNPHDIPFAYIPFCRDVPSNFPIPGHPMSWWLDPQTGHPDWVMFLCDMTTPALYDSGVSCATDAGVCQKIDTNTMCVSGECVQANVPTLDISNPNVMDYQLNELIPRYLKAAPYGAIEFDNFSTFNSTGACGHWNKDHTQWFQQYSGTTTQTDPQYEHDVIAWTQAMYQKLHKLPTPILMVPNWEPLWGPTPSAATVATIEQNLDGVLDEQGFTNFGKNLLSQTEFSSKVQFLRDLQAKGKVAFVVDESLTAAASMPAAELEWDLGGYLIAKDQGLFLSVGSYYPPQEHWQPEYAAAIGTPVAPPSTDTLIWSRTYTSGVAFVNPSTQAETFSLQPWTNRFGATQLSDMVNGGCLPIKSTNPNNLDITVQARTGVVLLHDAAKCP